MIQNQMSYVYAGYLSDPHITNKIFLHMWWHNDFMTVCEINHNSNIVKSCNF